MYSILMLLVIFNIHVFCQLSGLFADHEMCCARNHNTQRHSPADHVSSGWIRIIENEADFAYAWICRISIAGPPESQGSTAWVRAR